MDIQKAIEWMKGVKSYFDNTFPPVDRETSFYIIMALRELEQYRQIGTPAKCRMAVEKMKSKKLVEDKYHHAYCPVCGWLVCHDEGRDEKCVPYCENCGQAIDWSGCL